MTSRLDIYNEALLHLGQPRIRALTDSTENRRILDDAYDSAFNHCLSQGFWNFATRSVSLSADTGLDPAFGYSFAFEKPTDWVRTYRVSADESMSIPLTAYSDESGYWYANVDPIYLQYISNDASYGGDLTLWPQSYADYVSLRLAVLSCRRIEGLAALYPDLVTMQNRALISARGKDGMDEAIKYPPRGSWASSRSSSYNSSRSS